MVLTFLIIFDNIKTLFELSDKKLICFAFFFNTGFDAFTSNDRFIMFKIGVSRRIYGIVIMNVISLSLSPTSVHQFRSKFLDFFICSNKRFAVTLPTLSIEKNYLFLQVKVLVQLVTISY